jgi:hypothetical protein
MVPEVENGALHLFFIFIYTHLWFCIIAARCFLGPRLGADIAIPHHHHVLYSILFWERYKFIKDFIKISGIKILFDL